MCFVLVLSCMHGARMQSRKEVTRGRILEGGDPRTPGGTVIASCEACRPTPKVVTYTLVVGVATPQPAQLAPERLAWQPPLRPTVPRALTEFTPALPSGGSHDQGQLCRETAFRGRQSVPRRTQLGSSTLKL